MKKQNLFKRIAGLMLAVVVFISSTGFVSVKHFCNMTGREVDIKKTCCCDNIRDEQTNDVVKKSSCCSVKTNYFINAVASFSLRTEKSFFFLPEIKFNSAVVFLFSKLSNEINFYSHDKSPPLITGRILLLQKNLLLI